MGLWGVLLCLNPVNSGTAIDLNWVRVFRLWYDTKIIEFVSRVSCFNLLSWCHA